MSHKSQGTRCGHGSLGVRGTRDRADDGAEARGRSDPEELADLARRRLRAKIPLLREALWGTVTEHHRFMLRVLMDQLNQVEALIGRYTARIEEALAPSGEAVARMPRGMP